MVSSTGDPADLQTIRSGHFEKTAKAKPDWTGQLDTEQVFRLIDSILPFEACLYHQLLPLSLEGSRLKLGMVNLDDAAALDYVRRILAYMNCSLLPQTLATDVHHAALSAYLNYIGTKKNASTPPAQRESATQTPIQNASSERTPAPSVAAESATAYAPARPAADYDRNSHPTLLVDSPEELSFQDLDITNPQAPPVLSPPDAPIMASPDERAIAADPGNDASTAKETLILADDPPPAEPPEVPRPGDVLPELAVEPKHLSDPVEVLATLSAPELLVELMGRVLVGGIGRLYFERQAQHGRILWSQNGVLQSVLEELPLDTIQGVINELKLLTYLPLIPVQKPKQVEIERLYQKHRLLLRLRVMPGTYGEEATVQVLRGAALKFYQQQQLASLSRDALVIAQDLQRKVNEIRVRTQFYPLLSPDQLSILPALNSVLKSVEEQLEALKALQLNEEIEE